MKILAVIFWIGIILGSCAGCAITEEQMIAKEAREYKLYDEFQQYKEACDEAGGTIWIKRRGGSSCRDTARRQCPIRQIDSYSCVRL